MYSDIVSQDSYLHTVWYALYNIITMVTKHASQTTIKAQHKLNTFLDLIQRAIYEMIR